MLFWSSRSAALNSCAQRTTRAHPPPPSGSRSTPLSPCLLTLPLPSPPKPRPPFADCPSPGSPSLCVAVPPGGLPTPSRPAWWSPPDPPPFSVPPRSLLMWSLHVPPYAPPTSGPPHTHRSLGASPGAPPLPLLVYAPPTHPVLLSPLWSLSPPPLPHSRPRSLRARSYLPQVLAPRPRPRPAGPLPPEALLSSRRSALPPAALARQPGGPPWFPAHSARRHRSRSPTHPSRAGGSRSRALPLHTHSLCSSSLASSPRPGSGPAPRSPPSGEPRRSGATSTSRAGKRLRSANLG